jgi:xanthine dehydrogenase YagR molybdenum-binding subunit
MEQAVDQAAVELGIDPVSLRKQWDKSPLRAPLYLELEKQDIWKNRPLARSDGRFKRGVGVAAGVWYYFWGKGTQVQVETTSAGQLLVSTAMQDIGSGTRTVLSTVVGEVFGLPAHEILVRVGDSRDVRGTMTAGSRTTASIAPPAEEAAQKLLKEFLKQASDYGYQQATPVAGGLQHAAGIAPWSEVFQKIGPIRMVATRRSDPETVKIPAVAGIKAGTVFTASLQAVEVEVDTRLGRVRVLNTWTGVNAGRIRVPKLAQSQIEGSIVQGVGYTLYEEERRCPNTGRLLSAGLEDYRLPGIGDIPAMQVYFHNEPLPGVHGGGVGISELAKVAIAPAIGNAIFAATGWRPTSLPIRPDRVLAGLAGQQLGGAK